MTKRTARDEIWNEALLHAMIEESFKIETLQQRLDVEVSDRTVRDTLNTMVELRWLSKPSPRAHSWHPGPRCPDNVEDNFTPLGEAESDEPLIVDTVDEVNSHRVDRISSSANVVIEGFESLDHGLGTHGPTGESLQIPYLNNEPISVTVPRVRQRSRVLVCRETSIVRSSQGEPQGVKPLSLQPGDCLPVDFPLEKETGEDVDAADIDNVPLPLFGNVDALSVAEKAISGRGSYMRYTFKITDIREGVARGDIIDRSTLEKHLINTSGSNSSETEPEPAQEGATLDEMAESAQRRAERDQSNTTEQQTQTRWKPTTSEWDKRRAAAMSKINRQHG